MVGPTDSLLRTPRCRDRWPLSWSWRRRADDHDGGGLMMRLRVVGARRFFGWGIQPRAGAASSRPYATLKPRVATVREPHRRKFIRRAVRPRAGRDSPLAAGGRGRLQERLRRAQMLDREDAGRGASVTSCGPYLQLVDGDAREAHGTVAARSGATSVHDGESPDIDTGTAPALSRGAHEHDAVTESRAQQLRGSTSRATARSGGRVQPWPAFLKRGSARQAWTARSVCRASRLAER